MTDDPSQKNERDGSRQPSRLRFNQCAYLTNKRCLVRPDKSEIRLRAKTCQVFELLASKANELVTRDELVNHVWGNVIVTDDSLNQTIRENTQGPGRY